MELRAVGALALSTISLISAQTFAAPASCESLASLQLPDTTITTATVVPAGTFNPAIVTTACRVAGSIRPTSDSDIRFEVWMPTTGWNGKFLSAGEGGSPAQSTTAALAARCAAATPAARPIPATSAGPPTSPPAIRRK
jgi:hypothetical protein